MNKTLSTFPALQEQLRVLSIRMGLANANSDTEWFELIRKGLTENNLQETELVPSWLIDFLQCFIDDKEVDTVLFQAPVDETNLRSRCIGFISSVLGGEWEDEGETESVTFDSIRMQGVIFHEGNGYYTVRY